MKLFANAGADRTKLDEFERWASGLASTAMGSWGARRGGWIGLLALAGAGFLAWRAGTGQSLIPGQEQPRRAAKSPARRLAAPRPAQASRSASADDKAPAKSRTAKSAASKSGTSRAGSAKSSAAKALRKRAAAKTAPKADMKVSDTKSAETKTGATRTGGEIRASEARARSKAPRAKASTAKTSAAKTSAAKTNGAHHAHARSEAKPKPAPTAHS